MENYIKKNTDREYFLTVDEMIEYFPWKCVKKLWNMEKILLIHILCLEWSKR